MRRPALSSALLLLALLAGAPPVRAQALRQAVRPEEVGVSSERLGRLTATLDGYVDAGLLPGGVIVVARGGGVVLHQAFGDRDREARAPMSTDALFRIASQSKALVSLAVLTGKVGR